MSKILRNALHVDGRHVEGRRQQSNEISASSQSLALDVSKGNARDNTRDNTRDFQQVQKPDPIVLIEPRGLIRECLMRSLQTATGYSVRGYGSIATWLQHAEAREACLIVLSCAAEVTASVDDHMAELAAAGVKLPIVVLSDNQDPDHVFEVMEKGAKGLISSDITLDVAVQALRLVIAGGVYIPASCVQAAWRHSEPANRGALPKCGMFTARQASVVEALRKGKANKVIAYELDMRESTVKVHVRNIMKKLNARNRTEVAYLTNAGPTLTLTSPHQPLLNGPRA